VRTGQPDRRGLLHDNARPIFAPSAGLDLPDDSLSTDRRQSGILVNVHPVLLWNTEALQLPSPGPGEQPNESSHLERCSLKLVHTRRLRSRVPRRIVRQPCAGAFSVSRTSSHRVEVRRVAGQKRSAAPVAPIASLIFGLLCEPRLSIRTIPPRWS
jgi:hypothetical protein